MASRVLPIGNPLELPYFVEILGVVRVAHFLFTAYVVNIEYEECFCAEYCSRGILFARYTLRNEENTRRFVNYI